MADQSYRPNDENEYQYQEEQEGGEFKYSEDIPLKRKRFNFKPIIVVIVILLVLFGIYKLITHKRSTPVAKPADITQLLAPKTVAPVQGVAQLPVTTQAPAMSQEAMEIQKLQDMQKQMQDMLASQGKQQFQTQTSVMSVQASIDQINQQLQTITQSLSILNADYQLRMERAREAVLAKQRAEARLRKIKRYFVDAVIPGRAWLKGADGSTLTVTVGDTLPGYGKVLSINPYSGQVVTSKGVLPYGQS